MSNSMVTMPWFPRSISHLIHGILLAAAFGSVANAQETRGDVLRRQLFEQFYVSRIRDEPRIYLAHAAYYYGAIQETIQNNLLPSPQKYSRNWNEIQDLYERQEYRNFVDGIIGPSSPFGIQLEISIPGISVEYEVNGFLSSFLFLFRDSNYMSPSDFDQRLSELVADERSVRVIANAVYDGFLRQSSFPPMNDIPRIRTPNFLSPLAAPSEYLSNFSNEMQVLFRRYASGAPPELQVTADSDWESFAQVYDSVLGLPKTDQPSIAITVNYQDLLGESNQDTQVKVGTLLGTLNLNAEFTDLFATRTTDATDPIVEDFNQLRADYDVMQVGLRGLEQIAAVSDPNTASAIRVVSGAANVVMLTKLAMASQAKGLGALTTLSYGLGAVGAIATVFAALSPAEQEQPDPLLLELLKGQQEVLSQLAESESRLRQISSSVLDVQRDIGTFSLRTDRQLIEIAIAVDRLSSDFARAAVSQSAAQMTILEQDLRVTLEEFRVEMLAQGQIDWLSAETFQRIAVLQGFFLDTVAREPYVSEASLTSTTTPDQVMKNPWSYQRAIVDSLRATVDFYGFDPLVGAVGGNDNVLKSAYADLNSSSAVNAGLAFNHEAELTALFAMADVHAMSDRYSPKVFDVQRLANVFNARVDYLRRFVNILPLQIAVLRADSRNTSLKWRDRFRNALDRSVYRQSTQFTDDSGFLEFMISNRTNRVVATYDCLRGAADDSCVEDLEAPFVNVEPEAVLMAMGVVEPRVIFDQYPDDSRSSSLGYSPVFMLAPAGNMRFEVCIPLVQGLAWSPNVHSTYGMPTSILERYGLIVSSRSHCIRFPADGEPAISAKDYWDGLASRACDPRQGDCPKAFFDMTSEIWRTYGAPRLSFRVPTGMGSFDGIEYGGTLEETAGTDVYRALRQQSSDFAKSVLEQEVKRVSVALRESMLENSDGFWVELEVIDRDALALLASVDFLSADCKERIFDDILTPLLAETGGLLPSGWIRDRIMDEDFGGVYRYLEGLDTLQSVSPDGFGGCYSASRQLREANALLSFLGR